MYADAEISFNTIQSWKEELGAILEKWMFCYQPHIGENGKVVSGGSGSYFSYLKDIDNSFSMSDKGFRKQFISEFCNSIETHLNVNRGIEVLMKTKDWYECEWNDIALKGKNGNIFMHFGVSDQHA